MMDLRTLKLSGAVTLALVVTIGELCAQTVTIHRSQNIDASLNDYPTVARADYVFGCMAANGQTRQKLEQCSCSIDVIATILTYDQYVEAETVISVGLVGGEKTTVFNHSAALTDIVAVLRRAQAEAEFRCF